MTTIVFDIGVTNTRLGVSQNGRSLTGIKTFLTSRRYQPGVEQILAAGRVLAGGRRIDRAVGGFAGPLDNRHRRPIDCQARDWVGRPLVRDLSRGWRTGVRLENDAALNGLGEATHGTGQGKRIVGFLTLSTGINGVRIVDGQIDRNAFGYELRHLIVPTNKGRHETLGHMMSGRALARRYGRSPEAIDDRRVWSAAEETLAIALVNIGLAWSPDILVLGGSLLKSMRLPRIRRIFRRLWQMPRRGPAIVRGRLGDQSGLYGALSLARNDKNG